MSTQQPWSKSSKVVVMALGLLSVSFVVGLSVLIFHMLRPRGEKIGVASLTDPEASLLVNASAGDTLSFRIDVSVGLARVTLLSDDELERQASKQLQSSLLTVRAAGPSGRERVATCPAYKGRAASTSITSATLARSGMLNDCVIVLDAPGAWTLRGRVAWASDLTVQSAALEARLEAAAR
jgi:hypothetical protein